jgi:hypothetical protein
VFKQAAQLSLTLKNLTGFFVTQRKFYLSTLVFLWSSDKSLCTHIAQTRLISKYSVRILNTEDHGPDFPYLRYIVHCTYLLWRCHESGISSYPYITEIFQTSQFPSNHKFLLHKRLCHLHTHDFDTIRYFWFLIYFLVSKAEHRNW